MMIDIAYKFRIHPNKAQYIFYINAKNISSVNKNRLNIILNLICFL